MQAGYFQTAWNDIKHSDSWLKNFALLALLQIVPVFGQIVLLGYLYGWARDIAWNIHAPLPEKIFGNEDGKLYSRGFFILVITFVFSLVAYVANALPAALGTSDNGFLVTISLILSLAVLLFGLLCSVLAWVGSMRSAIYGRIGPGFQLKQIWKMFRYDTNGILRILGMNLLIGLILGIIFSIIFSIVIVAVGAGAMLSLNGNYGSEYDTIMRMLPSLGAGTFFLLIVGYVLALASVWLSALIARALGYWTRQFDVPSWGGQDAPLPFETRQAATQAQQAHYAAQVEYTQAQAEYAQAQGQQINQQDAWARQRYAQAAGQQQGQSVAADVQARVDQAAPAAQQATGSAQQPVAAPIQSDDGYGSRFAQSEGAGAPASFAGEGYGQAQSQPDWIAQANAMAPTEQRDPYSSVHNAQTASIAGAAQFANQAPAAGMGAGQPSSQVAAPVAGAAQFSSEAPPAAQPVAPDFTASADAYGKPGISGEPAQPAADAQFATSAQPAADAQPVSSSQDMHHRIEAKPAPRWEKIDIDALNDK